MAKGLITHAFLENTADAIRVLRGESSTYTPDEFGEKIIDAIPTEEVTDDIVSVTDAAAYSAEELEFSVEPVQDLHGYDKPWPAGGGKNLFNKDTALIQNFVNSTGNIEQSSGWSASDYIPVKSDEQYTLSGVTNSGDIAHHAFYDTNKTFLSSILSTTYTFTTPQNAKYVRLSLKTETPTEVMLNVGSTATSYEPYANICPISGWTGVNGERTGKNIFVSSVAKTETLNGITISTNGDGVYSISGTASNYTSIRFPLKQAFMIPLSDNYNLYLKNTFVDPYISVQFSMDTTSVDYWTFTVVDRVATSWYGMAGKIINALDIRIPANTTVNGTFSPMFLLKIESDTSYEPYTGTSIPITFPTEAGTVYGGKVDVVNGKLLAYPEYDSYNGETLTGEWISSMDAYVAGTTPTIGAQVVDLSGVGTEYDITPQQVQMLLGDNNILCDTGSTTLEYKVDLGRYIEKLKASQATPQLSLNRQAVSLDVGLITQEIKADVSERKSAETDEQEEQQQGVDED